MKKAYLDETCLFYLSLKNVNQMRMERIKGKEERKKKIVMFVAFPLYLDPRFSLANFHKAWSEPFIVARYSRERVLPSDLQFPCRESKARSSYFL